MQSFLHDQRGTVVTLDSVTTSRHRWPSELHDLPEAHTFVRQPAETEPVGQSSGVYDLSRLEIEALNTRARRRVDALGGSQAKHLLGVAGESCVIDFLRRRLSNLVVLDVSSSSDSPADLQVRDPAAGSKLDLEVKTVSDEKWRERGREIGRDQWATTTAVAYVWCRAENVTTTSAKLSLAGWLPRETMQLESILPPVPRYWTERWHEGWPEGDDDGTEVPLTDVAVGMNAKVLGEMAPLAELPLWIVDRLGAGAAESADSSET